MRTYRLTKCLELLQETGETLVCRRTSLIKALVNIEEQCIKHFSTNILNKINQGSTKVFSLCLTLKVILHKSKIIIALKGPLKSFLDMISN